MSGSKRLEDILSISNCDQLCAALYNYVISKLANNEELSDVEEKIYLLISMLPDIEMEGFIDLFYQFYSLRECIVVEETLKVLGLCNLANLFRKAKDIYLHGNENILSDQDFHGLYDHLSEEQRCQIYEIGGEILAEGSEIYQIANRLCQYIRDEMRL
jgi:hypothetical protein